MLYFAIIWIDYLRRIFPEAVRGNSFRKIISLGRWYRGRLDSRISRIFDSIVFESADEYSTFITSFCPHLISGSPIK